MRPPESGAHLRIAAVMTPRSAPLLLLVLVTVTLRESCVGASSHSLKYFSTAISKPSQDQPQFVSLGFVDGQVFVRYDSNSWKLQPRVSWMEKVGKEDPQSWERESQVLHLTEEVSRESLAILNHYNDSEGLHTLQGMYGCELYAEGRKIGFNLYGYEGRTFITFNTETRTWEALDPQAQIIQRKWDADPGYNQRKKAYLEEYCIEWLEKYLSYQKEALQRTKTPKVTIIGRTEVEDGMEMHVCRVDGFYPREIDASWRRDGEVWLEDTFHGSVAPNADGTYHYWLSIRIDPKERDHYRCHVEHDGLKNPLALELKEPIDPKAKLLMYANCRLLALVICVIGRIVALKLNRPELDWWFIMKSTAESYLMYGPIVIAHFVLYFISDGKSISSELKSLESILWIIICCLAAALVLQCVLLGIAVIVDFFKRRQATPESDRESDSSERRQATPVSDGGSDSSELKSLESILWIIMNYGSATCLLYGIFGITDFIVYYISDGVSDSSEPTDLKSIVWIIIGCFVAALIMVCVIFVIAVIVEFFERRCQATPERCQATPVSDRESDSSVSDGGPDNSAQVDTPRKE